VAAERNQRLLAQAKSGAGPVRVLAELNKGESKLIGPVISTGDLLYWVENRAALGTRTENLAMLPHAGGEVTLLGLTGGSVGVLRLDPERRKIYWVSGLGSVGALSLATPGAISFLAQDQEMRGGMTADAGYIYWASLTGIMRVAK